MLVPETNNKHCKPTVSLEDWMLGQSTQLDFGNGILCKNLLYGDNLLFINIF